VRISHDELAVVSFPGLDRSIRLEDLQAGRAISRRYRNRRIGEFLKELDLTEGRSTGIPKIFKEMAANGSPPPIFETDDNRISFVIRSAASAGKGCCDDYRPSYRTSHRTSHRGSRAPVAHHD